MNSLTEIAQIIEEHDRFVISGHVDPDGDCVGSMLALATALKKQGKRVRLVLEKLSDSLTALKDEWDYHFIDDFSFEDDDQIFIALDSGDAGRIPEIPEHDLPVINIDHHMGNTLYGDYNYVDEEASSTGELIYLLLDEMDLELTKKIGYYIAIAIIFDTGCFKYSNVNPRILRLMADLTEMGIEINSIYRTFLATKPLRTFRLKGLVYSQVQTDFDGKVAYAEIDQDLLAKAGATADDAYSLSGDLRDVEGVEVGVSFIEEEPGLIKIGFRSNEYVPVNRVASAFGGGGHERASGARVEGDISQIADKVIKKIGEYLE